MFVAERYGEFGYLRPEKAVGCDTLSKARVEAIKLICGVGDTIFINRTTSDRMYPVEEVTIHRADGFNEKSGRIKVAYAYYVKKYTPKGPEYYEISKKTGKAIRRAYGVEGFF